MPPDTCPPELRSARGYCPDDWQGHLDEVCGFPEYADAPFCAGPSLRECEDGTEVPEDQECPDTLDHPTGTPTMEVPVTPTPQADPPAELPATGAGLELALLAGALLTAGTAILTRTRRTP